LKDAKKASEVVALSIGPKQCSETLRTALAMGCDRGIHIQTDLRTDYMDLQPYAIANLFQKIIEKEKSDLVLLGKQGIDSDCGPMGPFLAGLNGWPQVTFAAKIEVNDAGLLVERETDSGTETLLVKSFPAVITCDLVSIFVRARNRRLPKCLLTTGICYRNKTIQRLNEPRYATLPNIMKAKKKTVETISAEGLGVDLTPRNKVLEVMEPPPRKAGVMVSDVDELIDKLRNEAKVLK
jgi:electron transfer flavoprotein beta subunit